MSPAKPLEPGATLGVTLLLTLLGLSPAAGSVGARLGMTGAAFVGAAPSQVRAVTDRVASIIAAHPAAARYTPAPIL